MLDKLLADDTQFLEARNEFIQMQNDDLDATYGEHHNIINNNHAAQQANLINAQRADLIHIQENWQNALDQATDERQIEMSHRLEMMDPFLERTIYIDYGGSRNKALATVLHEARARVLDLNEVEKLRQLQQNSKELDLSRREHLVEMEPSYEVYNESIDYSMPAVEQEETTREFNEKAGPER